MQGGGRGVLPASGRQDSSQPAESRDLCIDVVIKHAAAASNQDRARRGTLLRQAFEDKLGNLDRRAAAVTEDRLGQQISPIAGETARGRTNRVMERLQLGFLPFVVTTGGKLEASAAGWVTQMVRLAAERKGLPLQSAEASRMHVDARCCSRR